MTVFRTTRVILAFVGLACLAGCIGSRATIESIRLPSSGEMKRVMVVDQLSPNMDFKLFFNVAKDFSEKFSESMKSCGIAVRARESSLPPFNSGAIEEGEEFNADDLLTLQWTMQRTGGYLPPLAVYAATLYDLKRRRPVWVAKIDFTPGWYAGQKLAAELVDRLKKDSIVSPSCVTPKVPETLF